MKEILQIGSNEFILRAGRGAKVLAALAGAERVVRSWRDNGAFYVRTTPAQHPNVSVLIVGDNQVVTRPKEKEEA